MRCRPSLPISILASWGLAGCLLTLSFSEAFAVKATPDTALCSPASCRTCLEYEHTESGHRCVKCTAIENCTPASRLAMVKDDVDVYNSPVEPRKVIGIMTAGSGAWILEHHPDEWCKLDLTAFPFAHDGSGVGWIAEDHLDGCP
jgi:hypothetical protein